MIAATNRDLEEAVARGPFREDLYYRLRTCCRSGSRRCASGAATFRQLAAYFVDYFSREFRKQHRRAVAGSCTLLEAYAWPGNVRELRNAVERAMLLSDGDTLGPAAFDMIRPPAADGGAIACHLRVSTSRSSNETSSCRRSRRQADSRLVRLGCSA